MIVRHIYRFGVWKFFIAFVPYHIYKMIVLNSVQKPVVSDLEYLYSIRVMKLKSFALDFQWLLQNWRL